MNAVDPAKLDGMYVFEWKDGASDETLAALGSGGAIVKESFAKSNDLAVGDRFRLRTPAGNGVELRVAGLYQPPRAAELLAAGILAAVFPARRGSTCCRPSSTSKRSTDTSTLATAGV